VAYATFIYTFGGSLWNGTALEDTNDSFRYDPVVDSITSTTNISRATAETQALAFDEGGIAPQYGSWVVAGLHRIPLMKWTSTFRVPTRGQQARRSPPRGATLPPIQPRSGGSTWQVATITLVLPLVRWKSTALRRRLRANHHILLRHLLRHQQRHLVLRRGILQHHGHAQDHGLAQHHSTRLKSLCLNS
jgi:hypothetical protein